MESRHLIIILPITILCLASLTIFSFVSGKWPTSVSIYFAVIFIASIFTAKQSIFMQTSLFWELDDLKTDEKNILGRAITKDFLIYLVIYLTVTSIIYLGIYWLVTLI